MASDDRAWAHRVEASEVASRLGVHTRDGLGTAEAHHRLEKHGPNVLTPPKETPLWRQVLSHFTDFFSLMLQFAALLCVVAFVLEPTEDMHAYLAGFLVAVVVATSLFSFAQQYKSDKTLREFRSMLPPMATVVRDGGHVQIVPAADLVVGDVVCLKLGDKIPADVRITSSQGFSVDNSPLTGESDPCARVAAVSTCEPLEADNLAFFGTLAVEGAARGIVIATGDATVFGDIANLVADASAGAGSTTLHRDIHFFVVVVTIFAVFVGILFFVVGAVQGTKLLRNLVYSIGIIVSNVPEGLLATVTVSLTASARRMSRRNVLVKRLEAIETLGSTTVICSDKTGTLTQNRMSVAHIVYAGKVELIHPRWAPPVYEEEVSDGSLHGADDQACLRALLFGATNCATAVFDHADRLNNPEKTINELAISGDASEAGILRFTELLHPVEETRAVTPMLASLPFNSSNKYMISVHRVGDNPGRFRLLMKGAPEKVLASCSTALNTGQGAGGTLTSLDRSLLQRQIAYLAGRGERVLAYAQLDLSPQEVARVFPSSGGMGDDFSAEVNIQSLPTTDLCFVGLLSLVDPPRPNVPGAVEVCRNAGIRAVMVTGDHPATALSIAKQIGLVSKPSFEWHKGDGLALTESDEGSPRRSGDNRAVVVCGVDIPDIEESDWDFIFSCEEVVFARTSPHQKLLIVQQFQARGHIVSVTGDGVNDAPALKVANTGVAMGICGSEVSKEAADIVLLDDNFASIVNGVEEGRLVFDNLKKSISYTLTSNVPQLVPFLVFLFLQIPLPLTTVLILAIDLGTDIFPAISLAYEGPEWDLMNRPPRSLAKFNKMLLNPRLLSFAMLQLGIIQSIGGFFAYTAVLNDYGLMPQTLPGLDTDARFGSERLRDQRWLITEQTRTDGFAFEADWFSKDNKRFEAFFRDEVSPGFVQQTDDQFNRVLASERGNRSGLGIVSTSAQFNNMIKAVGVTTRRPPCLEFACISNDGGIIQSQMACFDVQSNSGPVYLTGVLDGTLNDEVRPGRRVGEGCFDLWTPAQERGVAHAAQSAFFISIVVAQIFTLLATRTRVLSLFQHGVFTNRALIVSIIVELIIAMLLVYFPPFRQALDIHRMRVVEWLPGLPFGLFILGYDEVRKAFIRRHLIRHKEVQEGTAGKRTWLDSVASFVFRYTHW